MPLHTLTLDIAPAMVKITGAKAVTFTYNSERPAADPYDGNARARAMRALASVMLSTEAGRLILKAAAEAEHDALRVMFNALPIWRRPDAAWAAQAAWRGGSARPVAHPDVIFHASAALARWSAAQHAAGAAMLAGESVWALADYASPAPGFRSYASPAAEPSHQGAGRRHAKHRGRP